MARTPSLDRHIQRAEDGLWKGILVFRWVFYVWMVVLALTSGRETRHPGLAWIAILVTGAWTVWLSVDANQRKRAAPWIDLALAVGLILVSGIVAAPGEIVGRRPLFAVSYPTSAVLLWGTARGPAAGALAAVIVTVGLAIARIENGLPLGDWTGGRWQGLVNSAIYNLALGVLVGIISLLLRRWADDFTNLQGQVVASREREARQAERASVARRLHDSVLQTLGLIVKRTREMTNDEPIRRDDMASLAELASRQERELRAALRAEAVDPHESTASLRDALRGASLEVREVPVTASVVGPMLLPIGRVDEITAAVRESLRNAATHAHASKVIVFAEQQNGEAYVSIRDDGIGFAYDEERLRASGRMGLLGSMKGRIEASGGTMRVRSAPGEGTEIEFRVPT